VFYESQSLIELFQVALEVQDFCEAALCQLPTANLGTANCQLGTSNLKLKANVL
jgi:hypothetical protein